MVLPFLEIVASAVVQLCPAVGTLHQPGKHIVLARLCRATLVLAEFLHPVPLRLFDNGGVGVGSICHFSGGFLIRFLLL